jgi:putative ABC transport system ATP-binding protein
MTHAAPDQDDIATDGSTSSTSPDASFPTPTGPAAARAVNLRKVYGSGDTQVAALDGVNVEFWPGQFTAIMGPSGSGKSTLMHCLAALDDATSGKVFVGDADLTSLGDKELTKIRRDRIGFVFQSFNLVPTLTAMENITLPMDIAGRKPDEKWLDTVISTVGLGDRLGHKPSQLSGGQQQRVACARALAGRPDIVFADEPTGNLDSVAGAEVLGFLRMSVQEFGQTVVMVTHDPAAAGYADRVLFLADGHIVDEMSEPTADRVLDRMKGFDAQHQPRPSSTAAH